MKHQYEPGDGLQTAAIEHPGDGQRKMIQEGRGGEGGGSKNIDPSRRSEERCRSVGGTRTSTAGGLLRPLAVGGSGNNSEGRTAWLLPDGSGIGGDLSGAGAGGGGWTPWYSRKI